MAQFRFLQWLAEWILSQDGFDFEWDNGNRRKSFQKHGVTIEEAQEVFEQTEAIRVLGQQVNPLPKEPRFGLLGVTQAGRHLFVCFTIRGIAIRVISLRNMSRKEKELYAKLCKE